MARPRDAAVHLWRLVAPDKSPPTSEIGWLARSERARAESFRHDVDRIRFLWRHTMLRKIAAGYCGIGPAEISFEAGRYGKPMLAGNALSFNCAHSDGWIFIAATTGMSIGVDVERTRSDLDWQPIAEVAFHPSERAWISDQADLQRAFNQIWVRREAMFKAWGKGLHDSMHETSLVQHNALAGSVVDPKGNSWWVSDLGAPSAYQAAVAASAEISRVVILPYAVGREN